MSKSKKEKVQKKPKPEPKKVHTSYVAFLLDRSWSMNLIKSQTIEGFNAYLSGLQEKTKVGEDDAEVRFTFLQFDTAGVEKFHVAELVEEIPYLDDKTFVPRGGTPLIDAAYETIQAVAVQAAKAEDKPRVVICIQTDGEENCSKAHTWAELSALVQQKQQEGWEFNFIGAGIDAYQQGLKMGIDQAHTMSYSNDFMETKAAFAASASNTRGFTRHGLVSTSYSLGQKLSSGDRHDEATNKLRESLNLNKENA